MSKRLQLILIVFAMTAQADERSEWLAERRFWIDQAARTKTPESMLNLARIVTGVGERLDQASPEAMDLFYQAKNQLLTIPGHAEYYRDKILHAQELLKNSGGGTTWSDYHKEIMYGFQTLPHLNSPEGVRVLGELLSNDWVPLGNETAPLSGKFVPLSEASMGALTKFPLVDKPFKSRLTIVNLADAQAAWLLWYEQIKAGKRTFRFEGDPTEYDLDGPASKELIQRVERDRKRDDERAAGHRKSSTAPESENAIDQGGKPSSIAWLMAIIGLCGAGGWYFLRGRQGRFHPR